MFVSCGEKAVEKDNVHVLDLKTEYYDFDYLKEESVERLRVAQWHIQATAAYEFAIPIAGYAAWWKGFLAEAEYGDWVLYDSYNQKVPILTSNITTPYTITFVDLTESAYYIEIPQGRIGGIVLDIYQRPQSDLGVLGPDKGKGRSTKRVREENIQSLIIFTALSKEEVEEISNELVKKIFKKRKKEEGKDKESQGR